MLKLNNLQSEEVEVPEIDHLKEKCDAEMLLSCSVIGGIVKMYKIRDSYVLARQISTLTRIHDMGFENVELYHGYHLSWFSETLSDAIKYLNLNACSIHLSKWLTHQDISSFKAECDIVFQFIKAHNIPIIVVHPPQESIIKHSEWLKRLDHLVRLAKGADSILTLENIPHLEKPIHEYIDLYNDNSLGVTIDIEHMHMDGKDIYEIIGLFGSRIQNLHIRDSDGHYTNADGNRQYLGLGEGCLDIPIIIQTLQEFGYTGLLTIEVGPPNYLTNSLKAKKYIERYL